MPGLTRSLAAPAASLALLATLGLGGIAYGAEDTVAEQPDCSAEQGTLDALNAGPPGTGSLLDLRAALDLAIGDEAQAEAQAALDARLGQIANAQAALDACLDTGADPTDEPPATDGPPVTDEPDPTEQPTTPPATEPPFVDRDCADLAPGEADEILAADPSDPHRLDRDNDGVPCEIEDLADEGANPDGGDGDDSPTVISGGPTAGSGSNSQFDAMPSTAPETGRA